MREFEHHFDLCVVGGGMAGLIAALAAARRGCKVALVTDRPVLGGNASSEIRQHICGANGKNMRETGILEELLLENHWRNPGSNYPIWDSALYGAATARFSIPRPRPSASPTAPSTPATSKTSSALDAATARHTPP